MREWTMTIAILFIAALGTYQASQIKLNYQNGCAHEHREFHNKEFTVCQALCEVNDIMRRQERFFTLPSRELKINREGGTQMQTK